MSRLACTTNATHRETPKAQAGAPSDDGKEQVISLGSERLRAGLKSCKNPNRQSTDCCSAHFQKIDYTMVYSILYLGLAAHPSDIDAVPG